MNLPLALAGTLWLTLLTGIPSLAQQEPRRERQSSRDLAVSVQIMELDRTKLRERGIEYQTPEGPVDFEQLENEGPLPLEFVRTLQKHKLAKLVDQAAVVLSDNGQEAEYFDGQEVDVPVAKDVTDKRRVGTELRVTAMPVRETAVRLAVDYRKTKSDSSWLKRLRGNNIPTFGVRRCSTSCDLELGQTMVIPGLIENSANGDEVQMLLLITAEQKETLETSVRR